MKKILRWLRGLLPARAKGGEIVDAPFSPVEVRVAQWLSESDGPVYPEDLEPLPRIMPTEETPALAERARAQFATVPITFPGGRTVSFPVFVGTVEEGAALLAVTPPGQARRDLKTQLFGLMYGRGAEPFVPDPEVAREALKLLKEKYPLRFQKPVDTDTEES